jgi:hypothetical protein
MNATPATTNLRTIPFRPKLRPVEISEEERRLYRIEMIRALTAELLEPGHPWARVPVPTRRKPKPTGTT